MKWPLAGAWMIDSPAGLVAEEGGFRGEPTSERGTDGGGGGANRKNDGGGGGAGRCC